MHLFKTFYSARSTWAKEWQALDAELTNNQANDADEKSADNPNRTPSADNMADIAAESDGLPAGAHVAYFTQRAAGFVYKACSDAQKTE